MNHKSPFGQPLLAVSAVSGLFWSVALARVEYVGPVALIITVIYGALWIIFAVRNACDFGSRYAADFVRGKAQPRKANGQFASKREIIHAALRRDVEAK